jgi:hypothetical protein
MTSEEKRWLRRFAWGMVIFTTLPYVIGFGVQGSAWRFTGFLFGVEDGNSYIAKMLSGAHGAWLFRTPYTAHPQNGILAFLPYILLGKLTSPPGQHEQLVALYHLFRLGGVYACVWATYQFATLFLKRVIWRRVVTVLTTLGGGLGWLAPLGLMSLWHMGLPLEFYSPETFGFLALLGLPHLAWGRAFLLWGVYLFLDSQPFSKKLGKVFLTWNALALMQPLTVVIGWVVMAGYCGARTIHCWLNKRPSPDDLASLGWQQWFGVVAISSPIPVYTVLALYYDSYLRAWTAQNIILSPPVKDYLFAYGPILFFSLGGIHKLWRSSILFRLPALLLAVWAFLLPLLVYISHPLQRRMAEGGWVALVMLAGIWGENSGGIAERGRNVLLPLFLLSALVFYVGALNQVTHPGRPLFRPSEEVRAFIYLAQNAPLGTVVLADDEVSNALPAWAPIHTLIGHGPESIGREYLATLIETLLKQGTGIEKVRSLIQEFHVDYIFAGPEDCKEALLDLDDLQVVYNSGEYMILKVTR